MADERVCVTFVATERTPDRLRRRHGEKYDITGYSDRLWPADGTAGTLFGIPGIARSGADGLEWEMTEPHPVPVDRGPAWAQSLAADLAEIKRLLQSSNGPPLGPVSLECENRLCSGCDGTAVDRGIEVGCSHGCHQEDG